MLTFALLLTGAAVYIEYYIVTHLKVLQKVMHGRRTAILALCFSMTLSVLLGGVFGAAGMTVMLAGLLSTAVMQPVYTLMRSGKWERIVRDVRRTVEVCVAIVVFPFMVIYRIVKFFGACQDWYMAQRARLRALKLRRS